MSRSRPEPMQKVKERRDAALAALVEAIPYAKTLGLKFDRRGNELTAILPYKDHLIGNPILPALHGGAIAAFLEMSAQIELSWGLLWSEIENERISVDALRGDWRPKLPKTIDFTVDFLRSGLPRDAYARARINRSGRRYASVYVEAWQDNRERHFAEAVGHFLMPESLEGAEI